MIMVLNEYTGERVHAPARLNKQFISFFIGGNSEEGTLNY